MTKQLGSSCTRFTLYSVYLFLFQMQFFAPWEHNSFIFFHNICCQRCAHMRYIIIQLQSSVKSATIAFNLKTMLLEIVKNVWVEKNVKGSRNVSLLLHWCILYCTFYLFRFLFQFARIMKWTNNCMRVKIFYQMITTIDDMF